MVKRIITSIIAASILSSLALLPSTDALAGGTCHKGQPVIENKSTTVTMSNNCFVATITRVDEGATVTFHNEDDAAHVVTGANYSWGMGSDNGQAQEDLLQGQSFEQTFADSGVYPYFCFLHPGMIGAVVVGDGRGAGADSEGGVQRASLASTAAQPQGAAEAASTAIDATDGSGGVHSLALATLIGLGLALLCGIVLSARTLTSRRTAAR
jgi:plastocyanin